MCNCNLLFDSDCWEDDHRKYTLSPGNHASIFVRVQNPQNKIKKDIPSMYN